MVYLAGKMQKNTCELSRRLAKDAIKLLADGVN